MKNINEFHFRGAAIISLIYLGGEIDIRSCFSFGCFKGSSKEFSDDRLIQSIYNEKFIIYIPIFGKRLAVDSNLSYFSGVKFA